MQKVEKKARKCKGEPEQSAAKQQAKKRKRKLMQESNEGRNEEREESIFKRKKGESARQFLARVNFEADQRLFASQKKAQKHSTKRKEYFKARKEKLKLKKKGISAEDMESLDFKDLQDCVKFGERVVAPPKLLSTLKGVELNNNNKKDFILAEKLKRKDSQAKGVLAMKHQKVMEEERQRVVEVYRRNKARQYMMNKSNQL